MLRFVYEGLEVGSFSLNAYDEDWQDKGILRRYSQADFNPASLFENDSLAPFGYVFYPKQCLHKTCRLHVHLHGCSWPNRHAGMDLLKQDWLGLQGYAVSNDLIIAYPELEATWGNLAICWDTIGYSGEAYQTKDSIQGQYLMSLVNRITDPYDFKQFNYRAANLMELDGLQAFVDPAFNDLIDIPYWLWYYGLVALYFGAQAVGIDLMGFD